MALSLAPAASADQNPLQQGVPPVTLPQVVVTAQKEPADAQRLPLSVSAVNRQTLDSAGFSSVGEASIFSPNTLFAELSARKVSNPYIRGIGSSPSNPGVTTYIDGVPQLNANSSNIELIDIEQIEFVRGAQSALFGRNALGGLINVSTARPSMTQWTSRIDSPLGTQRERGIRGAMSGPLSGNAALGLAFGTRARDGFTVNDVTGNTLDDRSATFGRAQFVYMPTPRWETRFIFGGERDRDGDYALNDLDEIAPQSVPRAAQRRGIHRPRHLVGHDPRPPRGAALRVLVDDRRRLVEDARLHRPRLLGDAAHDAQQRREGHAVHAGVPRGVRRSGPRAPVAQLRRGVAGRRHALLAALHAGRRHLVRAVRAVAVSPGPGYPELAERGPRRHGARRLRDGHADGVERTRSHPRRALRPRAAEGRHRHVVRSGDCAADAAQRRAHVLGRLAAGGAHLARDLRVLALHLDWKGLQGRRVQHLGAAGKRVVRRGAGVERRGRA